ncbi:MAG: fructose bisphosphate aldolase [Bacilli bacterium]|nr:fructose bisphosphate aldolase [Bacilli bacterium]
MKKEEVEKRMKEEILRSKKGFIAALDQSGGSSSKTLALYGVGPDQYHNDEEMFEQIHQMRARVITNEAFTSDKILGVILFKRTMESQIEGEYTANYLWEKKGIPSFLKIDLGLEEAQDGVQLLKDIPDLDDILDEALKYGIVGTKMRSVIHEYNEYGIKKVIEQQFKLAKRIIAKGLIPIVEPEVSIDSNDKALIEAFMKKVIRDELNKMKADDLLIFKFTIPSKNDFYDELLKYKNVVRIVALSGGYSRTDACEKLKSNKKMIASFSRALLEGLNVNQTEEEFTTALNDAISLIYDASVKK